MRDDQKPPLGPIDPGQLPVVKAPDAIWNSIVASLNAESEPAPRGFRWWRFAAACSLLIGTVLLWYSNRPQPPSWEVVRLDGSPSVGSKPLADTGRIAVGEWLQTDASSSARIQIGQIGTVEVEPNSRVRLIAAKPNEHRLSLARGEISAVVSAPPRLFFVDTPASTAVDLGCAYRMKTDESGSGLLRVTVGWVALEWKGRESLVPAGAICRTKSEAGPGIPYFSDASQALQDALAAFDFEKGGSEAVSMVLGESRVRDTLTLWHLLSRVDSDERSRVFDRMVELAPLPQGISREKILELDKDTLRRWSQELAWKW
ncbi:MAG TPA: FecR domain-containing protein [Bryobacteraceae bacterium]|nr:FecR domain-containing protein [Bryobacteraceae bacterium]